MTLAVPNQESKKSMAVKATKCKLCKKSYIFPCDGERYDCANAVWVRSQHTIDLNKLPYGALQEFRESGKKVPGPELVKQIQRPDTAKPKRIRVRLDEPEPKKLKKRRK